jgi:hypothetical protein
MTHVPKVDYLLQPFLSAKHWFQNCGKRIHMQYFQGVSLGKCQMWTQGKAIPVTSQEGP